MAVFAKCLSGINRAGDLPPGHRHGKDDSRNGAGHRQCLARTLCPGSGAAFLDHLEHWRKPYLDPIASETSTTRAKSSLADISVLIQLNLAPLCDPNLRVALS